MRLIDADALLEKIMDIPPYCGHCDGYGFLQMDMVADSVKEAPTIEQPAWISVEERLPDNGEGVLLYDRVFQFYELGTYYEKGKVLGPHWTIEGRTYPVSDYTHWMPLPQPRKEWSE